MLGGINPYQNNKPLSNSSSASSSGLSPKAEKHLKSQEFKSLIQNLGIDQQNITDINEKPGLHVAREAIQENFQAIQIIEPNPTQQAVLNALGLTNVELALVLSSEEELKKIKKQLKEIEDAITDPELQGQVLEALGLESQEEAIVLNDQAGGIVVIKKGLQDLLDED